MSSCVGSTALALAGLMSLGSSMGCSVFDPSLLSDVGGCQGARPPARVTEPDEPGDERYVVVLRDVFIDQRGEMGSDPREAPWRTIGFDLDGHCTTADAPTSECTPAEGLAVELDGDSGIDNTFGNRFFPVLSLGATGIDTDLIASQEQGIGAVLLLVDDWNGELDDAQVTVTVTQTVFGTTAGADGAAPDITVVGSEAFLLDGTTPAPLAAWDGTDYFWARDDTFVAGNPELPNVRVTSAYVTDGVLVARLPDRTPIKLVGTDIGVEVTLTDLVVTGNIYEMFTGPSATPPKFVVAGRWGFNDMIDQAANVGICQGTSLFRTLTTVLNDMVDVLQDPPDDADPNLPCDALSLAVTFDAYAGNFGGVAVGQDIPSPCPADCGDGIVASNEQCDDGMPAADGDGCSTACAREAGYACTGAPSVCTTVCGDGIVAGAEPCDDGCLAGVPGVCEPADDGDGCSSACVNEECGNGVLADTEQCDDGNLTNDDGCSATCAFEYMCGVGETLVQIRSADVPQAIPENNPTGVESTLVVPFASQGQIRSVMVGLGRITHTYDADLSISVASPSGRRRTLVANRGFGGQNFVTTRFDDAAATAIASGFAPFSGRFRPEQPISTSVGFRDQHAAGTWALRAVDSASGDVGAIVGWTLSLCVDSSTICGDGIRQPGEECDDGNPDDNDACSNHCELNDGCGDGDLDPGEVCDDDNVRPGDGCSATCQIDIACGNGETAVIVANNTSLVLPDATPDGTSSPVTVASIGSVKRAVVFIAGITHPNDGNLNIFLVAPGGAQRELSSGNASGGQDYRQTFFDDTATVAITDGTAPFWGTYRPETSLAVSPGVDFRSISAAGVWNLRVVDDTAGDTGTLDGWALALCVAP